MRRPIILVSSTGNLSSSFRKVFLVSVKFNVQIKWIHTLIHSLHSVFRTFVFIWMTFYDRPRAELRSTLRTNITGNERKKSRIQSVLPSGFSQCKWSFYVKVGQRVQSRISAKNSTKTPCVFECEYLCDRRKGTHQNRVTQSEVCLYGSRETERESRRVKIDFPRWHWRDLREHISPGDPV